MVRLSSASLLAIACCCCCYYSGLVTAVAGLPSRLNVQDNANRDMVIQNIQNDTICTVDANEDQSCYPRLFKATNNFQVIKPGQQVPPNLHVQIDMQTGQRLARLMPGSEDTNHNDLAPVVDGDEVVESNDDTRPIMAGPHDEKLQEYIDELVAMASAPVDNVQVNSLLQTLGELEELVHETRHAKQLLQNSDIVVPSFIRLSDPTHKPIPWPSRIRRLSSVVLGAAVQNNRELQELAHSAGAVPAFIHSMEKENDMRTAGKHIFALSAMVRGHSGALMQFTDRGGMRILRDMNPMVMAVKDDNEYEARKLDMRIIRFVEDMFNPDFNPDISTDAASLVAQNAAIWCDTLAVRMMDNLEDIETERPASSSSYSRCSVYARTLQSLKATYSETCKLSAEFGQWLQDEIARVPKTMDESAEEYRQALIELAY
ncbi:nucleotide exchange factor sil1 [Coemansia erecta]|uniref:Nucleotide exchange factor sil1 n=1 Tax=Coemansia asiatica TaxID=1052880 RepID=A0A9W7XIU4_9FUNG|nr:nucleotide exchange factor sil1 [Coemansia asiatica]KAJ2857262.1 nucleotide exchange factor sil1 [Coemansia erecta]KAJ2887569.1 nucleotide exchange factor sil1 [Coemansia asiatica]